MARTGDTGYTFMFGMGLTGLERTQDAQLGDGTYNFYRDDEGYLVNYPGSSDVFYRPPGDHPVTLGVPPLTNTKITRVFSFRDSTGSRRTLFVQGSKLNEKDGNGYKEIHEFTGVEEGGLFYPSIFMHDGFLVIVNPGDSPLLWDGLNGVVPLGVRERLAPPVAWPQKAIGSEPGAWTDTSPVIWHPLERPINGPASNVITDVTASPPSTTNLGGTYKLIIQGVDRYGNVGPASGSSPFVYIPNDSTDASEYLVTEWLPPMNDVGIHGYILGRTVNLREGDDEALTLKYETYYEEARFDGTTLHRFVCQVSDANLADNPQVDTFVIPAPISSIGASWSNRIFLGSHDESNVVYWSDQGKFGQFRILNSHKCLGAHQAIIPMGDRIAVVTSVSVEVLYDNSGTIVVLDQLGSLGSVSGRSLVEYKDKVFGLWTRGFGFYDGSDFKFVNAPYFVSGDYVDNSRGIGSAVVVNNWYLAAFRGDGLGSTPNRVIMMNLETGEWYLLHDEVYDFALDGSVVLMCNDTIREMFRGGYSSASRIVLRGLSPKEKPPGASVVISGLRLLMQPSSSGVADVTVKARRNPEGSRSTGFNLVDSPNGIQSSKYHDVVWGDPGALYSGDHDWSAPDEVMLGAALTRPPEGSSHDIEIEFPAGAKVSLRALEVSYSSPAWANSD
jgi:hypothetical protein